jgi:hypothetical protein
MPSSDPTGPAAPHGTNEPKVTRTHLTTAVVEALWCPCDSPGPRERTEETPCPPLATTPATLNGLDLAQMHGTVALLQQQPALARFEFRASNRWVSGGENRSRIQEFYGAGAEDASRTEAWEFVNGEPPGPARQQRGRQPGRVPAARPRGLHHHHHGAARRRARHRDPPPRHRARGRPRPPGLPGARPERRRGLRTHPRPHGRRRRLQRRGARRPAALRARPLARVQHHHASVGSRS